MRKQSCETGEGRNRVRKPDLEQVLEEDVDHYREKIAALDQYGGISENFCDLPIWLQVRLFYAPCCPSPVRTAVHVSGGPGGLTSDAAECARPRKPHPIPHHPP